MPRQMARQPKATATPITVAKRQRKTTSSSPTAAEQKPASSSATDDKQSAEQPQPASVPTTKIALILSLLSREQGATLAELIEATSWQPHTTRAALTGLRKKGHAIDRGKRGDETCYRVPEVG